MKLFIWTELFSLWGAYTQNCGHAFALASSKEEAIQQIIKGTEDKSLHEELERDLKRTEPSVYENPVGFSFRGEEP